MIKLTNQCVRFVAKQEARLIEETLEVPELQPGEILGKTVVSLISTGSERGGYMDYNDNMAYPQITGYAAVLRAVETGKDVTGIKKGDLFFADSPHHEYAVLKQENVLPLPEGMTPEQGVFCRFPAVSMSSLIPMSIRPTEPVLVTGLGLIGLLCSQLLQNFGYDVWCIDPVEKRRENGKKCGLLHVVKNIKEIPDMVGSFGAAAECSGDENATYDCADNLRHGGELFLVGVPWRKSTEVDGHTLLLKIFYGFLHVHSGWEWNLPRKSAEFLPDSNRHSLEKSLQWMKEGRFNVDGIYRRVKPGDCTAIYREIGEERLQQADTCVMFDWR
ncbi:MAG: zinc-binding dehydrogenase [Anaerocolumna sp.]